MGGEGEKQRTMDFFDDPPASEAQTVPEPGTPRRDCLLGYARRVLMLYPAL